MEIHPRKDRAMLTRSDLEEAIRYWLAQKHNRVVHGPINFLMTGGAECLLEAEVIDATTTITTSSGAKLIQHPDGTQEYQPGPAISRTHWPFPTNKTGNQLPDAIGKPLPPECQP